MNFLQRLVSALATFAILTVPALVDAKTQQPLPVPNSGDYHQFLLKEWDHAQPSIVMMVDPFCPYCIRSLKNRERLRDYNVFLIWAPILGRANEVRVEQILRCNNPASAKVISAVINRKAPNCPQENDARLAKLNKEMVEAYDPQSVPAYYFGGQRVSVRQLDRYVVSISAIASNISLDWNRYAMFHVAQPSNNLSNVGVLLPDNFKKWDELLENVQSKTQFDWYLISDSDYQAKASFCDITKSCDKFTAQEWQSKREEILLLLGLSEIHAPQFILNNKLLTADEADRILGFRLPAS